MMKNKAIHAMIIGTCIFVNSMAGVYADTTAADTPVSIQGQSVSDQNEIDKLLFEKHAKDLEKKGITVTHTGAVGDSIEVGVMPNTKENADYIYQLIGKDNIILVDGEAYMLMATTGIAPDSIAEPANAAASPIASFFGSLWDWIKSIF